MMNFANQLEIPTNKTQTNQVAQNIINPIIKTAEHCEK